MAGLLFKTPYVVVIAGVALQVAKIHVKSMKNMVDIGSILCYHR